jgi:hypothetical protein
MRLDWVASPYQFALSSTTEVARLYDILLPKENLNVKTPKELASWPSIKQIEPK